MLILVGVRREETNSKQKQAIIDKDSDNRSLSVDEKRWKKTGVGKQAHSYVTIKGYVGDLEGLDQK